MASARRVSSTASVATPASRATTTKRCDLIGSSSLEHGEDRAVRVDLLGAYSSAGTFRYSATDETRRE